MPLQLGIPLALLAPLALAIPGGRAAAGSASRADALARGAWAGGLGGAVLFLLSGAPAAATLGLIEPLAALPRAPLPGLSLGVPIAASVEASLMWSSVAWLALPAMGAAFGVLGAWRSAQEGALGTLKRPNPLSLEAGTLAVGLALFSALVVPAMAAALLFLANSMARHVESLAAEGLDAPARPWVVTIPFWLVWVLSALASALTLRGVAARAARPRTGADRLLTGLALASWLVGGTLTFLVAHKHLGVPMFGVLNLGVAAGLYASTRTRARAEPAQASRDAVLGWTLAGAVIGAWWYGYGIGLGLGPGLGVVSLISTLQEGSAPPELPNQVLRQLLEVFTLSSAGISGVAAVGSGLLIALPGFWRLRKARAEPVTS